MYRIFQNIIKNLSFGFFINNNLCDIHFLPVAIVRKILYYCPTSLEARQLMILLSLKLKDVVIIIFMFL